MTRITINPSTVAQLTGLSGAVELCDPLGNAVGLFQPLVIHSTSENTPQFTQEELQSMAAEPGGRPLREILRDIEGRS